VLARTSQRARLVLSPDDDSRLAARAIVRFHLRVLTAVEDGARTGDVDAVHELRIATRRLRAAIRLFAPLLPARFVESAENDLGWLAGHVGAVRDRDVLFAALQAAAARLDPELRERLGPVGVAVHEERAHALAELEAALDADRYRALVQRLSAFVEGQTSPRRRRPLGETAAGLVRPLVRSARRAGRRLDDDAAPAMFHRLRVRVKRLRYALETLRGFGGKPLRRLLRGLENLQDVLGEAQDAVTQIAWLRGYAAKPRVRTASLLPVGAVIQALSRRGTKRRRKGLKAWRRLEEAAVLDHALAALDRAHADRVSAREVKTA
jgi:triphosphatase